MPNPDPFFAAADRIAYDLHTKLWRFVYEFRATKALSSPRTSSSMYWYESETGPGTKVFSSLRTHALLFWQINSVATPSQIPHPLHIFFCLTIEAFRKMVASSMNL